MYVLPHSLDTKDIPVSRKHWKTGAQQIEFHSEDGGYLWADQSVGNSGTVLQSDIEKIKLTLAGIDQKAFELAIDTILSAKRIYVVGIRSCAPLASFLCFYLNLVCENVTAVNTNSSSEIFEQLIRINEEDVIIGSVSRDILCARSKRWSLRATGKQR